MKRIIRSLLEYSRITSEGRGITMVPVDRVLAEVQQNLNQRITESGAMIRADAMPEIRANETQMLQLFQNLIGNAVKFRGSQPPEITIRAEEQPEQWLFSVTDNGIGMDMKHAEKKIFQVFQRLHGRDEYEGTGIGLAISKKIVERHGGTIWADSQPGKGTIFYFTLKK
jgi:light-regulated signal transduction histidine kinase (bacteriophytochrome)